MVVGGGTGNHNTTLTGLKRQDCHLVAVVAMTDSGGSSGKVIQGFGHLPHEDIRRCLVALASEDQQGHLMRRLFDYRFHSGDGLSGHSFGDLLLAALTEVTGNTMTAIGEASALLGAKGKVVPVTLTRSTLVAKLEDGNVLTGESTIDLRQGDLDTRIDYVYLSPKAYVYPPVLAAIQKADALVFAPGNIYTSVLPNLLVEEAVEAINASNAVKIQVCNLMTKPAETGRFKASTFVNLLLEYLGTTEPLDYFIYNSSPFPKRLLQRYAAEGQYPVELDLEETGKAVKQILSRPVLAAGVYIRHDPFALARAIMEVIDSSTPGA
jgi:uncharacterized cofD-like protein